MRPKFKTFEPIFVKIKNLIVHFSKSHKVVVDEVGCSCSIMPILVTIFELWLQK